MTRVVGPVTVQLGVRRGWLLLAALTGWEWAYRRAVYVR